MRASLRASPRNREEAASILFQSWIGSQCVSLPYGAKDLASRTAVELLVNGRDLKDLVDEYEQSIHYSHSACHAGSIATSLP